MAFNGEGPSWDPGARAGSANNAEPGASTPPAVRMDASPHGSVGGASHASWTPLPVSRVFVLQRLRHCREAFMRGEDVRRALLGLLGTALADSALGPGPFIVIGRLFRTLALAETSCDVVARVLQVATDLFADPEGSEHRRLHPGVRTCLARMSTDASGATFETAATAGRAVGVSASHLTRLFRRQTGLSLREWQSARRMQRAVLLLARSEEFVSQVAYALGYADTSRFSHECQRTFGLCPRRFREVVRDAQL
jgi:AraC-like DNA-binding protein